MSHRRRIAPFLAALFIAIASAAAAFTAEDLLVSAQALESSYADLIADAEQAQPPEHAGLIAEYLQLEAERAQLVADRATLGSCSCSELDALLAVIEQQSDAIGVIVDTWED